MSAIARHLEDTTRAAVSYTTHREVCDSAAQRISALRELTARQSGEIDLLQRVVERLTDDECACGVCKQCSCRGILQGSLRRYPRKRR